jgi:hypothetical protein
MNDTESQTMLTELSQRIDQMREKEATIVGKILIAEQDVLADPDSESAKEKLLLLKDIRETIAAGLDSLLNSYKVVREKATAVPQTANVPAAIRSGISIRLMAPPPFSIGQDFEVFAAQFVNYVGEAAFSLQLQALKSMLAADAFKACRSTLDNTNKTDLKSILAQIRPLVEPRKTLAARVNEFHNCTQRPDESLARFASRIRSSGDLAYPDVGNPEPYLIQQFVRGAHATSVQKNIVSSHDCATLNDALNKVAEVVNVNDLNAEVFEVTRPSLRTATDSEKRCYNCNRIGHLRNQCYARSKLDQSNGGQREERNERVRCQICSDFSHLATHCRAVKITPNKTTAEAFHYKEERNQRGQGGRPTYQSRRNNNGNKSTYFQNKSSGEQVGVPKNANGLGQ